jgi:ubiquinone biosynthesis protein UbiJ
MSAIGFSVLLLGPCQRLLNRYIAESTTATRRLADMEGRSFAIVVRGLDLTLVLSVRDAQVALSDDGTFVADATIQGTPLDLLGLLGTDSLHRLRNTNAELSGNVHVAESFADILRLARPDLEAELALWVGEIAAHRARDAARNLMEWASRSGRALEMNLSEYLQEEGAVLPGRLQVESFYNDVEQLRDDVERSEQRLARIERRATALS